VGAFKATTCAIKFPMMAFCSMEFAVSSCWFSRLNSTYSCVAALANPISLNVSFLFLFFLLSLLKCTLKFAHVFVVVSYSFHLTTVLLRSIIS
jgi:hypothetical protein